MVRQGQRDDTVIVVSRRGVVADVPARADLVLEAAELVEEDRPPARDPYLLPLDRHHQALDQRRLRRRREAVGLDIGEDELQVVVDRIANARGVEDQPAAPMADPQIKINERKENEL